MPRHVIRLVLPVSLVAGAISLAAACGGTSDTGPGGGSPDFTVTAGTPAATTLGTTSAIAVSLHSTGFTGSVTITVTGAPASWIVAPPSPVYVAANGDATDTIHVTTLSNGDPAAAGQTLTVHAVAGSLNHTATSTVTVANEYVIPIALGTGTGAHWPSLTNTTIHLNVGTSLTFQNDDTVPHRIHTNDGVPGFPHETTDLAPGATYVSVITGAGSDFPIYCHNHGENTGAFTVTVP